MPVEAKSKSEDMDSERYSYYILVQGPEPGQAKVLELTHDEFCSLKTDLIRSIPQSELPGQCDIRLIARREGYGNVAERVHLADLRLFLDHKRPALRAEVHTFLSVAAELPCQKTML